MTITLHLHGPGSGPAGAPGEAVRVGRYPIREEHPAPRSRTPDRPRARSPDLTDSQAWMRFQYRSILWAS